MIFWNTSFQFFLSGYFPVSTHALFEQCLLTSLFVISFFLWTFSVQSALQYRTRNCCLWQIGRPIVLDINYTVLTWLPDYSFRTGHTPAKCRSDYINTSRCDRKHNPEHNNQIFSDPSRQDLKATWYGRIDSWYSIALLAHW